MEKVVQKYWTYKEVNDSLPWLQPRLKTLTELLIKLAMLARRVKFDPSLMKTYATLNATAMDLTEHIESRGIWLYEALHGIVLFPLLNEENFELGFYVYREGNMYINSWITEKQFNLDCENKKSCGFIVGVPNTIPDRWK